MEGILMRVYLHCRHRHVDELHIVMCARGDTGSCAFVPGLSNMCVHYQMHGTWQAFCECIHAQACMDSGVYGQMPASKQHADLRLDGLDQNLSADVLEQILNVVTNEGVLRNAPQPAQQGTLYHKPRTLPATQKHAGTR